MINQFSFQPSEKIIFTLRSLYDSYGYSQYKMSKFEEYDLYSKNKDFLISDSVITFTDTNGKLMALKPDVTLSIVKNTPDEPNSVSKLYYNENVYRVAKGSRSFRELMQVGLECLGDIDDYCICEVLLLAAKSLKSISENSIIDISHLGLLSELCDSIGIPDSEKVNVLRLIGEKNLHELSNLCDRLNIEPQKSLILKDLLAIHGTPSDVTPKLQQLVADFVSKETIEQFTNIVSALSQSDVNDLLRIDFSVVDDINYYNGIVFKGFIDGVPNSVLSGGEYNTLMQKMKRKSGAIGFAVYLDMLEQLNITSNEYDVDVVLLYDESAKIFDIQKQAEIIIESGKSVSVKNQMPKDVKYRQLMKMENGEVKIIENNA